MSEKKPGDSTALAEDRTDLAEDRTLLANERTFAGWARTSAASIGLGLGFHALFGKLEPEWVPKAIATLFLALGVMVIVMAERRSGAVQSRLETHQVETVHPLNMRLIAAGFSLGAVALAGAIWLLA